ncbi:MAG: Fur family transcriptional regulator [Candidatus Woesearchaeota archaeon]
MAYSSRKTKQKELIQREVSSIKGMFSAEDLYNKVSSKDSSIGIATIYRYLKEAKNKGELYSYICNRRTIYSKGKNSHCHFICEKTGKTIHIDIDNIDFLKNKIPGTITSFQIEVKGVCDDCSIKE